MNEVRVVNFGPSFAGLATVGYRLTGGVRTTAGVSELVAGSGAYGATITRDGSLNGSILWDTGGSAPEYAVEEINPAGTPSAFKAVNFGRRLSGLSTVGYTVTGGSRVTAGVSELAAGSGVYGALVAFQQGFSGAIVWDVGIAPNVFVADGINTSGSAGSGLREALVSKLLSEASITSVVGTTIRPGTIPELNKVPALVYRVSDTQRGKTLTGYDGLTEATVTLFISSNELSDCEAVAAAIRNIFDGYKGLLAGSVRVYFTQMMDEEDAYIVAPDSSDRGTYVTTFPLKFKYRESFPTLT